MRINREELAWAGGLFEGEGCLHLSKVVTKAGYRTRGVIALINIADRDVLDRFHKIMGMGLIFGPYKTRQPSHKPLYQWRVCTFERVQVVIASLWPWLGARRKAKAREILIGYRNATLGRVR